MAILGPEMGVIVHKKGSGHVLECKGLPSMDVMVATTWNCPTCISMAPHGVTRLTCTKCNTGYSMECSMVMQG